jgi:hypothetical protein
VKIKPKGLLLFHATKTGIGAAFCDDDVATFARFDNIKTLLIEFFCHARIFFDRWASVIRRGCTGVIRFFSATKKEEEQCK